MNQALLQQQIEAAIRTALGDLSLQLLVAQATKTALEEENRDLKTRLAKATVGSEAEQQEEKGADP